MDVTSALLEASQSSLLALGKFVSLHHEELCTFLTRVAHDTEGRTMAEVKSLYPHLGKLLAVLLPQLSRSQELCSIVAALDVQLLLLASSSTSHFNPHAHLYAPPTESSLEGRISAWTAAHLQDALSPAGSREEDALMGSLGFVQHELSRAVTDERQEALQALAQSLTGRIGRDATTPQSAALSTMWPLLSDARTASALAEPLVLLSAAPPLSHSVRASLPLQALLSPAALARVWRTQPPEVLTTAIQDQLSYLARHPASASSSLRDACEPWAQATSIDASLAQRVEGVFHSALLSPQVSCFAQARLYCHYHLALYRIQERAAAQTLTGVSGPVAVLAELLLQTSSAELLERISALLPTIEALQSPLRQQAWLYTLRFMIPILHSALTCLFASSASQLTKSAAVRYIAWLLMPMNASRRVLVQTSLEHAAAHISAQPGSSSRTLTEVAPSLAASGVLALMALYFPSSSHLDWVR